MKLINVFGEENKINSEEAVQFIKLRPKDLIKMEKDKILLFNKPNQILFVIKKPTKKVLDFVKNYLKEVSKK